MGIFNQNVLCQGLCSQEPVWSEGRSTLNRFSLLTCLILCHTENFLGLPESSGKWGIGSGTKCEAEAPGFNWAREEKLSFQATPWNITHLPALSRRVLSGGQEAVLSPIQTPAPKLHTKQELPLSNPF